MSSIQMKETWMVVDETYNIPTWAECYAVGDADMRFLEETQPPEPATESDSDRSWSGTWKRAQRSRGAAERSNYRAPAAPGSFYSRSVCSCWRRHRRPREYMSKEFFRRRSRARRFFERSSQPQSTSWVHLPVVIKPSRWYQVVGSEQCSHCKAQGRYQITSWMCQCCKVALCIKPYRNCYSKWHGERF